MKKIAKAQPLSFRLDLQFMHFQVVIHCGLFIQHVSSKYYLVRSFLKWRVNEERVGLTILLPPLYHRCHDWSGFLHGLVCSCCTGTLFLWCMLSWDLPDALFFPESLPHFEPAIASLIDAVFLRFQHTVLDAILIIYSRNSNFFQRWRNWSAIPVTIARIDWMPSIPVINS